MREKLEMFLATLLLYLFAPIMAVIHYPQASLEYWKEKRARGK